MKFSSKVEKCGLSPMRKFHPYAVAAEAKGKKIYHLNIGQPDLPSPKEGLESLKHIDRKVLEYSPSDGYRSLREKLVTYYEQYQIKLSPEEIIVTTGGSEAVLFAFMSCLNPGDEIIVPEPAYANYMAFAISAGAVIRPVVASIENGFALPPIEEFEKLINDRTRGILICNPNNPTSTAVSTKNMRRILDTCMVHGIFVMIDETYVEFAPDINAITAVPLTREFTNLMVLRGVSKFFAAPGMRLGYGITGNMEFLAKMREKQTPWSLNSLGAFAGEIMLQDEDYIKETRNLILSERDRMIRELRDTDTYKIYPAYANFILLRILKNGLTSYDVFEACIRQGMMIRDCSSFQCLDGEFVRFCIMMPEDNSRLVKVLKSL